MVYLVKSNADCTVLSVNKFHFIQIGSTRKLKRIFRYKFTVLFRIDLLMIANMLQLFA